MLHSERSRLLAILIIAFLIRLTRAIALPTDPASLRSLPDQLEYLTLGQNLLHDHAGRRPVKL